MKRKIGTALVVGAGISGIRAALDLAESGYGVTLIDRKPHIGGILSQLDYQFPTDRCGMCKMLPMTDRDSASQYCLRKGLFHENIDILLSTEIASVEGEPGNFNVTLKEKPGWISPSLCIGCGECVNVCPVEVPDEFNAGLSKRKAVYLPVPHAIPNPFVIDMAACTRCGECEKICPTGAIQLSIKERKKFRILVTDDELIVRDSLKEWLEDEDFTVDMAGSGQEALDMLAKEQYQMMLLDIKMQGMDGVEVLKKAKDIYPDLCVVMMTAYATVETAVEAMKVGAFDYLMKPFDPDVLIPKIVQIYQNLEATKDRQLNVGAILLCAGTSFFNPKDGKNTMGYGVYPNVITSLEFERIFSGTGPSEGQLVRPYDGKPIGRVAWIQCVGSRDLHTDSDFCSTVCCMYAIKEAMVAKEKLSRLNQEIHATIFYMDMRTFGKPFQRYRDHAEESDVCFERARVHSVSPDEKTNDLVVRYVKHSGEICESSFDMIVLAVGQRPAPGSKELAENLEIPLNQWGFVQTEPFSLTKTNRNGIVIGGSFSGLKDINESVTQASAAALSASRVLHSTGGSLSLVSQSKDKKEETEPEILDISKDPPKILVVVCTCGKPSYDPQQITQNLKNDPAVSKVVFLEQTCTAQGWDNLVESVKKEKPNRILIGACLPYVYSRKVRELSKEAGLNPGLIEVVDIRGIRNEELGIRNEESGIKNEELGIRNGELGIKNEETGISASHFSLLISNLKMGISKVKWADTSPVLCIPIFQKALVIGGGIAGMTAALAIADHGFHVDLVEKGEVLGGNLLWLQKTLEGYEIKPLLDEIQEKVEKHPLIQVHLQTQIAGAYGTVGKFYTTLESPALNQVHNIEHGITILAVGGKEATTTSYGYGTSKAIITQKEFEQKITDNTLSPEKLNSVVMIQCVDSREEPRNYCSRVCCISALKHALYLKEKNPDIAVYILYRDIMTYGFAETYYTQARRAGIIFIQYDVKNKPQVETQNELLYVTAFDPILGQNLQIEADMLVLSAGIIPNSVKEIAVSFGADTDQDGFFKEAESKWRPVDSIKEGIFACGIFLSPHSVAETVATAEAAAQRGLRLLFRKELPAGRVVAKVRHSLCSLCERCIEVCPYGARSLDTENDEVTVNPVMCQGCGACAAVCPNSASLVEGYSKAQMFDVIDAAIGF